MAAVRTEHETDVRARRGLLHGALVALEAAIAAPADEREPWCARIRQAVDRLAFTLADHVEATEASDGLLHEIEQASPWLHARVERLRRDHVALVARTEQVLDRCHAPFRPEEVRADVADLLDRLTRHRHASADLLYDAYELDVNAGD